MPYLTQLAAVARRTGFQVVELPGWQTAGHGEMGQVEGVVLHHDASNRATKSTGLQLAQAIRVGRPDLPGPDAHYYIDRAGVIYVMAAGLCWHAGAVRSTYYANAHSIGIEAGNDGTGEPWAPAVMASYIALTSELLTEFDLAVGRAGGHREVCSPVGRKIDPTFDVNAFRSLVGAYQPVPATTPTPPPASAGYESPEDAMYTQNLPVTKVTALDVVRVPAVGDAVTLGPNGKCWVSLSSARDAFLNHVVLAGPGHWSEVVKQPGQPLKAGQPLVIELPAHVVQVEVEYTSPESPIGVLVEPKPQA